MRLFKKKAADKNICAVQTAESRYRRHPFGVLSDYSADCVQYRLFETLRESVPLIDGALDKIVRLTGDFDVKCNSRVAQSALRQFLKNVKVGANGRGIACFINSYLNQLLTYGTAVGEIVPYSDKSGIAALYNASLDSVELKCGDSPLDLLICSRSGVGEAVPVKNPSLILHTALNPAPGKAYGRSILRGLPFVSDILLKIFNAIGENWERVGNIRFAVSCSSDGANAKERAQQIARQWSLARCVDKGYRR